MSTDQAPAPLSAPVTLAGMAEGVRLTLPMTPGVIFFAGAFGAAAAEKGLGLFEATFMSFAVYAGASQLIALELWKPVWTFADMAAVWLVVFAVNLRLVLMGAALQPWLSRMPNGQPYGALATLTDANFVIGSRYRSGGGEDAGVFLGSGLFLWAVWTLATIPGHMAGLVLAEPRRFGLDLIMPIIFTIMAVGLFKRARDAMVWPIAAGFAVAASLALDGFWFIIVGAVAGSLAAGALRGHG